MSVSTLDKIINTIAFILSPFVVMIVEHPHSVASFLLWCVAAFMVIRAAVTLAIVFCCIAIAVGVKKEGV